MFAPLWRDWRKLGNQRLAAHLFAATQQLLATLPLYLKPMDRSHFVQLIERTRSALGESNFAAAWLAGQAWSLAEAVVAGRVFSDNY